MILLLDNRDSFVHNIARHLRLLGEETLVRRSDEITLAEVEQIAPDRLVISPGPGRPEDAGVSVAAVERLGAAVPTLGICLGQQCIGAAFGAGIVPAARPAHGVATEIRHAGRGLFRGLPDPLTVGRYHSLVVSDALPDDLVSEAWTNAGEVMAVAHRTLPVWGIQFHPESVLTPEGPEILKRFLEMAGEWEENRGHSPRPFVDRGLLYGEAAFETVLARRGAPFRLDRHLVRLRCALDLLAIPWPWKDGGAAEAELRAQVAAGWSGGPEESSVAESVVRILVTRGLGAPGLHPGGARDQPARVVVDLSPFERQPRRALSAVVASRPRFTEGYTSGSKTVGYQESILALREAQALGADEAILLDRDRCAVGGSASNLFSVHDGILRTPPLEGIRDGVTRELLVELAQSAGHPVLVERIPEAELRAADGIILTSAVRGPVAISYLDGIPLGADGSRELAESLRDAWDRAVDDETGGG